MFTVDVDPKVVEAFNDLKFNRKYSYMICDLDADCKTVILEKTAGPDANFDEVSESLPKDDARYVICDFNYETNENPPRKTNKLILFLWVPVTTKQKRRFSFPSASSSFVKECGGFQKEIQCDDKSQVTYESVKKELLK
jgi:hypothetical protein